MEPALVERAPIRSPERLGEGGDVLRRYPVDEEVLGELSDYLLLEEGRSDQTVRGYCQQAKAVAKMLDKRITQISPEDIRYEVKRDQCCALSTKQLRVTSYRTIHKWALLERKWWADAAMLGVKAPSSPRRLAKPPISLHDARKLLANCQNPNEYRVVYLPLYGGLRVCESARIDEDCIHGDRLTFIGKGDKERTVPIHPELAKALPIILAKKPKSKGVLQGRFAEMRSRLAIKDARGKPATTHSLRRTCADFMYDRLEVRREVVRMILGHGTETVDLYAPVRFGKMKEAIGLLDYSIGEPVQLVLF